LERTLKFINPVCSDLFERHVEQVIIVTDLTGFSVTQVNGQIYDMLKQVSRMTNDNYPEMLG